VACVESWRASSMASTPCQVELLQQNSFARCTLGKTFGCTGASSIWVANCRGRFRCGPNGVPFRCGVPPGAAKYSCRCSSARRAHTLLQLTADDFRSLSPYFHTADADRLIASETTPRFSNMSEVREWQRLTRARLRGVWTTDRPHASCAVVGSSAALLARRLGSEIDSHALVIRANQAPLRGYEAHVGTRTDLRVWGFVPLPRDKRYAWARSAVPARAAFACSSMRSTPPPDSFLGRVGGRGRVLDLLPADQVARRRRLEAERRTLVPQPALETTRTPLRSNESGRIPCVRATLRSHSSSRGALSPLHETVSPPSCRRPQLAGYCWRSIATDADPRFHPSAWRRAQRLIHVNHTRCARLGCYPSTGAMAVLYAIDNCRRVTVYGFGSNEAGAPTCVRPDAACLASERRGRTAACRDALTCEVGSLCQKYSPRLGEPSGLAARARHCAEVAADRVDNCGDA